MSVLANARPGVRRAFLPLVATIAGLFVFLGGCADPKPSGGVVTEQAVASGAPATPSSAECGKRGLPDCPLQSWMKANLQAYLKANDTARLADALDTLAQHEPSGFSGWSDAARRAAKATRAGDLAQVRVECKRCHDELRPRFRAELRPTRLF
jgi:hypothetical protein